MTEEKIVEAKQDIQVLLAENRVFEPPADRSQPILSSLFAFLRSPSASSRRRRNVGGSSLRSRPDETWCNASIAVLINFIAPWY